MKKTILTILFALCAICGYCDNQYKPQVNFVEVHVAGIAATFYYDTRLDLFFIEDGYLDEDDNLLYHRDYFPRGSYWDITLRRKMAMGNTKLTPKPKHNGTRHND